MNQQLSLLPTLEACQDAAADLVQLHLHFDILSQGARQATGALVQVASLQEEADKQQAEVQRLQQTTAEELYMVDLDAFVVAYHEWEAAEATSAGGHNM